jgi:parvulin-like peptidyl-prolyl isomerase
VEEIVAVVNDEIITASELNQAIGYMHSFLSFRSPNLTSQNKERIKEETLNQLIDEKLMSQKAREKKLKVEEEEVEEVLKNIREKYSSPAEFEASLKRQKMSLTVFKEQLKEYLLREKLVKQEILPKVQTRLDRASLEKYYQENQEKFKPADKVTVRELFIAYQYTAADKEKTIQKMKELRKRLFSGEKFEDLVQEYSDDFITRYKGGDLGFFEKGEMVESFEKAAFELKEGEVSEVVETPYGYHLIKVLEREGKRVRAAHLLLKIQPGPNTKKQTEEKLRKILEKKEKIEFAELVKKYSEDPLSRKEGGLKEDLSLFIFSEKVREKISSLSPGEISEPVESELKNGQRGLSVYQLIARKEGEIPPFEEVEEYVKQAILGEEIKKWLEQERKEAVIEVRLKPEKKR